MATGTGGKSLGLRDMIGDAVGSKLSDLTEASSYGRIRGKASDRDNFMSDILQENAELHDRVLQLEKLLKEVADELDAEDDQEESEDFTLKLSRARVRTATATALVHRELSDKARTWRSERARLLWRTGISQVRCQNRLRKTRQLSGQLLVKDDITKKQSREIRALELALKEKEDICESQNAHLARERAKTFEMSASFLYEKNSLLSEKHKLMEELSTVSSSQYSSGSGAKRGRAVTFNLMSQMDHPDEQEDNESEPSEDNKASAEQDALIQELEEQLQSAAATIAEQAAENERLRKELIEGGAIKELPAESHSRAQDRAEPNEMLKPRAPESKQEGEAVTKQLEEACIAKDAHIKASEEQLKARADASTRPVELLNGVRDLGHQSDQALGREELLKHTGVLQHTDALKPCAPEPKQEREAFAKQLQEACIAKDARIRALEEQLKARADESNRPDKLLKEIERLQHELDRALEREELLRQNGRMSWWQKFAMSGCCTSRPMDHPQQAGRHRVELYSPQDSTGGM